MYQLLVVNGGAGISAYDGSNQGQSSGTWACGRRWKWSVRIGKIDMELAVLVLEE